MTVRVAVGVPACPPLHVEALPHGQVSYRAHGDGPPLVFLHGLLGSSKSWAWQFAPFAPRRRVIAWDAPGFGQSSLVPVAIDAYAEALRDLLAAIGAPKICLVGHSMGGTVATRFAARFPDQVSRLVLSCTHPGYGEPESAPMSAKFENRMHDFATLGRAAYGLARARDLLPEPRDPAVLAYAAEVASEVDPDGLRRATRMLQLADNRPLLPTLRMPVMVLTGAIDTVVAPRLKADLMRLTPITRHVDMPGIAHAPYFQSPDMYNGLIEEFLSAG